MQYILLIYGNESVWEVMTAEERERAYAEHEAYGKALADAGVMRGGAELKPSSTAKTVRFGGSEPMVVDGPFAETKEQLGGYYLIETDTHEEALAWARRMPAMTSGAVEVRRLGAGA